MPRTRTAALLAAALATGGPIACEHPIAVLTPHIEAADLEVRDTGGALVVRTRDNRTWEGGPLLLADRQARTLRVTALDFQGVPIRLEGRTGVDVRAEAEPAAALVWEPRTGEARVTALASGAARIRLLVWHETHADLVTPWLDVIVGSPATSDTAARRSIRP
jgi:hypothetical protein